MPVNLQKIVNSTPPLKKNTKFPFDDASFTYIQFNPYSTATLREMDSARLKSEKQQKNLHRDFDNWPPNSFGDCQHDDGIV